MKNIIVCKFGGSSVADSMQIKKAADIIKSDNRRKIIVVSAPKDVTDNLIACAKTAHKNIFPNEELNKIKAIYNEIGQNLNIQRYTDEMLNRLKVRLKTKVGYYKKFEDYIKTWGEFSSAYIISRYLEQINIDSRLITPGDAGLFVSEDFGDAKILEESYKNLKKNLYEQNKVIIFPGFYGRTKNRNIAAFSRGGSDLTGALIAASIEAVLYENWTDKNGIRNADPRIVSKAKRIERITYREIRELAYIGFSVFHAEAMIPAMKKGISINIKNTNNPDNPGTLIVKDRDTKEGPVIGIASRNKFASFNIEKVLMDKEVGFGRKLLEIFENSGLSYEHFPSGIDSFSIIIDQTSLDDIMIKKIKERIMQKLNPDSIEVEKNKCLICVAGLGLKRTPGILSRITNSIANENINIEMLSQGGSEISLIMGLEDKSCKKAINAVYNEFF